MPPAALRASSMRPKSNTRQSSLRANPPSPKGWIVFHTSAFVASQNSFRARLRLLTYMTIVSNYDDMSLMTNTSSKESGEGRVPGADPKPRRVGGRRERRKLATHAALLDAARSLLVSRSMDALTVDEIIEYADVARGTFYNYFPDKDALERELASETRARIEGQIAQVNQGVTDPPERIARAFVTVLRVVITEPQQAIAMRRLFPHATNPAAPANAGVRRDVTEGIAQRRIVARPVDVVVAYVMGVFLAGVNRALDLTAGDVREFAQGLDGMLLHGLGLKPREAERIVRLAIESILAT